MPSAVHQVPETMRAWLYRKCGKTDGETPLELCSDVAVPRAGKGEVLVRVQASAVAAGDWKLQSGMLRPILPARLPFSPCFDIAGEVVQLGPGSSGFSVGDQVFGHSSIMKGGGLSEYALLPVSATARRPTSVPPEQAACLPVSGQTALQALEATARIPVPMHPPERPRPGSAPPMRVLVAGGSGGVGHFAVQMAKAAGAHVTATCGTRNLALVRGLGADEVLDYTTPEGDALLRPGAAPYDVVFDCTDGKTWAQVSRVLTPRGAWVLVSPGWAYFKDRAWNALTLGSRRIVHAANTPCAKDTEALARLAEQGRVRAHISLLVPLEEAPRAWKEVVSGHATGKVVVRFPDPQELTCSGGGEVGRPGGTAQCRAASRAVATGL